MTVDNHPNAAGSDDFDSAAWRRARRCGPDGGNCVEVNDSATGRTAVRDSKPPISPTLVFADAAWHRFLTELVQ
jgi:hypothetical protein